MLQGSLNFMASVQHAPKFLGPHNAAAAECSNGGRAKRAVGWGRGWAGHTTRSYMLGQQCYLMVLLI